MLKRKGLLIFTILVLIAGTAAGIAIATSDDETPITGDALTKATAAALQYTGGGTVTETEVGDEEGYYEVEVTMSDGTEIDVRLDQNFKVIGLNSDKDDEAEDPGH